MREQARDCGPPTFRQHCVEVATVVSSARQIDNPIACAVDPHLKGGRSRQDERGGASEREGKDVASKPGTVGSGLNDCASLLRYQYLIRRRIMASLSCHSASSRYLPAIVRKTAAMRGYS